VAQTYQIYKQTDNTTEKCVGVGESLRIACAARAIRPTPEQCMSIVNVRYEKENHVSYTGTGTPNLTACPDAFDRQRYSNKARQQS